MDLKKQVSWLGEPVSALKTLAGKLLLVPLALENGIVLAAGLAGGIMWLAGGMVEVGSSDPWQALLTSWLTFFRRLTFTFLLLGGLAWFLRRVKSRTLASSLGAEAEASQSWFFLVRVILAAQGFLAAIFAHPLLPLFQENIQLLQSWGIWEGLRRGGEFSGVFLVPVLGILLAPGLAAMAAIAFIAGAGATLGYLCLGLGGSPRVLLRSICLQTAFLLGLYFTHPLFEAGIRMANEGFPGADALELKARALPWLAGQISVLFPLAQRLAWLLPGFLICAAVVLRKAREKERGGAEKAIQFPEEIPTAESAQIESPGSFFETDERFNHKSYLIKWRFFSNPLYKVFDVFDSDNKLIFVARMNGLTLFTRNIRIYAAEKEQEETLFIIGRRFIRFPNMFALTYCPTNKIVGTFKNSHAGWVILDEYGRKIAAMKSEEMALGSAKWQLLVGRLSVCKYTFQNILKPILTINFPEDSAAAFDRKLAIGLALVLGFQAVAFNYSYGG